MSALGLVAFVLVIWNMVITSFQVHHLKERVARLENKLGESGTRD